MFEYKEASFYTSYFKNHPDFELVEEFKELEDQEEKNNYVGSVEVLGTIHPLLLRVEIPKSFPHQKLTFRTKSISGYPHLIHQSPSIDPNVDKGDWFCLNTPFAETAEGQLEQEIFRLKEWIKHQLRKDLPAHITDSNVISALRFANAYDWENLDEMNEFSSKADLTFIGDFSSNPDNFEQTIGHFHCIKTKDHRYYALKDKLFTNYELPYIIVDEFPKSIESLSDFVSLRNQYEWDDSTCKHLLPSLNVQEWSISEYFNIIDKKYSEEEALSVIKGIKDELSKDDSYLPGQLIPSNIINNSVQSDSHPIKVPSSSKTLIIEKLNELEEKVINNHGYNAKSSLVDMFEKYDEMDEEERMIHDSEVDYWCEIGQFLLHFFVLGVRNEKEILWIMLGTNTRSGKYEETKYNLEIANYSIKKLISYELWRRSVPQKISNEMFFGRGAFSKNLVEKKIAIVGLGAIGSILAESLARSGIYSLGLWDSDIVEPGNICRSIYDARDLGGSKVQALAQKIRAINPICEANEIVSHGYWYEHSAITVNYVRGSFYNEVNYNNQEEAIDQIKDYDLIIDCTGSNEMLHFLSYAIPDAKIISLCITNHSNELVCITSRDGNPFELRKAYLSRIEQDTKNFYLEGSGCYSPTFLATYSDISSLVNLAVRNINQNMKEGELLHSTIWSHNTHGIIADKLETYKLDGYDIRMTISSETIYDGEEMNDVSDGKIGYILGSYSKDGLLIMVTHIIDAFNAEAKLTDAFKTSKGIIDYIGDYVYSGFEPNSYTKESFNLIANKAADKSINTCNPLLVVRNPDRTMAYYLYINNRLVPFRRE